MINQKNSLFLDDNIMITDDGKILHIDFGCAFGQKTKLEKLLGLFMDIPHSPFSGDVFIGRSNSPHPQLPFDIFSSHDRP